MAKDVVSTLKDDKISTALEDDELIINVGEEKITSDSSQTEVTTTVEDIKLTSEINGGTVLNPNDFVPYTGATDNVNLGSYNFTNTGIGSFGQLQIYSSSYYIDTDGSNNLTFTDPITGTKTLAELSIGGGGGTGDFIFTTGNVDLYIATDGDDSTGDGSSENPWATPQKLVEQMALYRTDGTITGYISDGTYTNPTPASHWLVIPDYALGNWVIEGNESTPTNVVLDGDDTTIVEERAVFYHFNHNINLQIKGINLKNAYTHINTNARMNIQSLVFDNYKYAVNMIDGAIITSYGGYKTLTLNGSSVINATGFRMLNGASLVISENVRMIDNQYDFVLTGSCSVKLQESVNSTYESTLSSTEGRSAINASRESIFECNMDMMLDGGSGTGDYAISLTSRARFYSFPSKEHLITNYTTAGWYMGVGVVVNEPYDSLWFYSSVPDGILADYSVKIESADTLNTTITWGDYSDIIGYDYRYSMIEDDSGAPSSTPTKVGNIYIDTSGGKVYISTGTTNSTDWKILN